MTLVETVVALTLFAICIGGMTALVLNGRALSDGARDHYTAINIAKNRLERIKSMDFDQVTTARETGTTVNMSGSSDANGDFRRVTTITSVATNLYRATVQVDIRNRVSRSFSGEKETISSYVVKYVTPP
jgi:Tfp pilus assembly protein PilV